MPDGSFPLDDDGRLIANAILRRRFDYFLTAQGEEDDALLRARVAALAVDELTREQAAAALVLYDRYRAYRRDGAALIASGRPDAEDALAQLRRERFGGDADAFFADDDAP